MTSPVLTADGFICWPAQDRAKSLCLKLEDRIWLAQAPLAACAMPIGPARQGDARGRPADTRLDTAGLRQTFGAQLPRWQDGAGRVLRALGTP